LISVVTIFGLLMFVSTLWFNQPAQSALADNQATEYHSLSFASSSPIYIAAVKLRITNTGTSGAALKIGANVFGPKESLESFVYNSRKSNHMPHSLWLLNRSLLI
ncbi:MAG: hypothetical protein K8F91_19880, partial [Candidatus Obscuribacterales bacterium]|nr:hypothetical protein [Candidatus Obscuribacterales bacterium]